VAGTYLVERNDGRGHMKSRNRITEKCEKIELVVTARNSTKFCLSDLHGTRQVPNYPWSGLSDGADIDLSSDR
jgi:hypothetical protein